LKIKPFRKIRQLDNPPIRTFSFRPYAICQFSSIKCTLSKRKTVRGMIMKNVRDILHSKGDAKIYSVAPGAMVVEALKLMAEKQVGALLVLENGKVVGIFSERDYARKIAL